MAKGVVAGLAATIASQRGVIELDAPVCQYIESWCADSAKRRIRIHDLLSHSSGIPHGAKEGQQAKWESAFWGRHPDLFSLLIDSAPVGQLGPHRHRYSGPAFGLFSVAMANQLASQNYGTLANFLREHINAPLQISDDEWLMSYEQSWTLNGVEVHATWGGAKYSVESLLKIGQLILNRGVFDNVRIIDLEAFTDWIFTYDGTPDEAGSPVPSLGWWHNGNGALRWAPRGSLIAAGAHHQLLIVMPTENLVVLRLGRRLGDDSWGGDYWRQVDRKLLMPLMHARNRYTPFG